MERWLRIEELLRRLPALPTGDRRIGLVVLHHTWQPNHASWRGDRTAEAVRDYWLRQTQARNWRNPLGAHFLVSPEGIIYQPYPLWVAVNANGNPEANRRGIAVEAVGDFDRGHDVLEGRQRHAVMGLLGGLLAVFGLGPLHLMFHRDYTRGKSCPGTSLQRNGLREESVTAIKWARSLVNALPQH